MHGNSKVSDTKTDTIQEEQGDKFEQIAEAKSTKSSEDKQCCIHRLLRRSSKPTILSPGVLIPKTLWGSLFDSLQVETQSRGVNASGT